MFPVEFEPKENELIYHYCSPETFLAICQYKTLRFSDIQKMNDPLEINHSINIFNEIILEIIDTKEKEVYELLRDDMEKNMLKEKFLISCLSLDGDLLSQWRGYANGGDGFSIGFDWTKMSPNMEAVAFKVVYEHHEQKHHLKMISKILTEFSKPDVRHKAYVNTSSFGLSAFKNEAYKEEKEVRLVHPYFYAKKEANLDYKLNFIMQNGSPKAYLDIDFSNIGKEFPIKEIIIGPKNSSTVEEIYFLLETFNIPRHSVRVRKTDIQFR